MFHILSSFYSPLSSNMFIIFPCVSMKGERSLRVTDHAKNLFSIVCKRVTRDYAIRNRRRF